MAKLFFVAEPTEDRFKEEREKRFRDAIAALPNRGGGLHSALLGVCNLGAMAGLGAQEVHDAIAATGRAFRHGEIEEAIAKAGQDAELPRGIIRQRPKSITHLLTEDRAKEVRAELIAKGGGSIDPFSADVWEASSPHPEALPSAGGLAGSECRGDMITFLRELYQPDNLVYVGNKMEPPERQRNHIKTAAEWISFFAAELEAIKREPNEREQFYKIRKLAMEYPYFIANPLTGEAQPLKSDPERETYRSDGNVASCRYIVVESDSIPLNQQIPLLCGLKLPVSALIYSGGKSIHALIDATALNGGTPIKDDIAWKSIVDRLFSALVPLGFDGATKNPSRLSRLPGIWRPDKNQFQRLLYICKKGGALCLK